jgi:hypothetical protein
VWLVLEGKVCKAPENQNELSNKFDLHKREVRKLYIEAGIEARRKSVLERLEEQEDYHALRELKRMDLIWTQELIVGVETHCDFNDF